MTTPTARPEGWECPWCGPSCLEVDASLPAHLQLCATCSALPPPVAGPIWEERHEEARSSLRPVLDRFLADFYGPAWAWCDHGKAILGNAILGAMEAAGLDRLQELAAAAERMTPATRAGYERDRARSAQAPPSPRRSRSHTAGTQRATLKT